MKHKPIFKTTNGCNGGSQEVYKFDNLYGASVVCHHFSYGYPDKFELGVLKFDNAADQEGKLCYDTIITDDVIGNLDHYEYYEILDRIAQLDPDTTKEEPERTSTIPDQGVPYGTDWIE